MRLAKLWRNVIKKFLKFTNLWLPPRFRIRYTADNLFGRLQDSGRYLLLMYKTEDGKETVRPADFNIQFDKSLGECVVYPDVTKGLSFSNSIQRLKDIPIKGKVWLLPRDTQLPEDLVVNYNTIDHPLINVSKKMTVATLISKLKELEKK